MGRPLFVVTVISVFCLSFIVTSLVSGGRSRGGHESIGKLAAFEGGGVWQPQFGKLAAFEGGGVWQPQYGCQGKLSGALLLSPMWCTERGTMYFYDGTGITTTMSEPRPSTDPSRWPLAGDARAGELWIAARP